MILVEIDVHEGMDAVLNLLQDCVSFYRTVRIVHLTTEQRTVSREDNELICLIVDSVVHLPMRHCPLIIARQCVVSFRRSDGLSTSSS